MQLEPAVARKEMNRICWPFLLSGLPCLPRNTWRLHCGDNEWSTLQDSLAELTIALQAILGIGVCSRCCPDSWLHLVVLTFHGHEILSAAFWVDISAGADIWNPRACICCVSRLVWWMAKLCSALHILYAAIGSAILVKSGYSRNFVRK